jgi:hypothetical protein
LASPTCCLRQYMVGESRMFAYTMSAVSPMKTPVFAGN